MVVGVQITLDTLPDVRQPRKLIQGIKSQTNNVDHSTKAINNKVKHSSINVKLKEILFII